MKRPVIGITTGEVRNKDEAWSPVTFGQSHTYVNSIIEAGGIPLLLPLTRDETVLTEIVEQLDGIMLAGGNDLSPELYGETPRTETRDYSPLRDTTEAALLARVLKRKLPILGICRGMQLLNVHFGGTLYQDIAAELPGSLDHHSSTKLKTLVDLSHTLKLVPDSQLAHIIGSTTIGVNAHHHQAIRETGKNVTAVAWTTDGIIEGVELKDYPFAVGIQAHPESLTTVEPRWKSLFVAFVKAAN